jgi:valyl-tRNA synthetase
MGTDVRFDVKEEDQDTPQVELGRNFANKLWNAGRFLLMKRDSAGDGFGASEISGLRENELSAADRWIYSRSSSTAQSLYNSLEQYRLNDYSKALYEFVWRDFCDWYVEIFKVEFAANEDAGYRQRLSNFGLEIYDGILRLLHPLMPFITEELWQNIAVRQSGEYLCASHLPEVRNEASNANVEQNFELLQQIVEEIRRSRGAAGIQPSERIPVVLSADDGATMTFLQSQGSIIAALARCSPEIGTHVPKPEQALASVVRGVSVFVVRGDSFDPEKEILRLTKESERLSGLMRSIMGKLNNEGFMAKAKPEVIEAEREKFAAISEAFQKVQAGLNDLGA